MGDEVHGTIAGAALSFRQESSDRQRGLVNDLERAERLGLFAATFDDSIYDQPFWAQFDRIISMDDVQEIRTIIGPGIQMRG